MHYSYADTEISIIDQNGSPVSDAVFEIEMYEPVQVTHSSPFVMDQIQKAFVPNVLALPKNSYVSFPNSDDIRHHVYSFSKTKSFELKLYAGEPKSPILFENSGVVVLGCNIHDAMVGYLYIHDNNTVLISDSNGKLKLDQDLSQLKTAWLWHPRQSKGIDKKLPVSLSSLLNNKKNVQLIIELKEPELRDSFEDVFSHVH